MSCSVARNQTTRTRTRTTTITTTITRTTTTTTTSKGATYVQVRGGQPVARAVDRLQILQGSGVVASVVESRALPAVQAAREKERKGKIERDRKRVIRVMIEPGRLPQKIAGGATRENGDKRAIAAVQSNKQKLPKPLHLMLPTSPPTHLESLSAGSLPCSTRSSTTSNCEEPAAIISAVLPLGARAQSQGRRSFHAWQPPPAIRRAVKKAAWVESIACCSPPPALSLSSNSSISTYLALTTAFGSAPARSRACTMAASLQLTASIRQLKPMQDTHKVSSERE